MLEVAFKDLEEMRLRNEKKLIRQHSAENLKESVEETSELRKNFMIHNVRKDTQCKSQSKNRRKVQISASTMNKCILIKDLTL